ncbi:unnamed protein product [Parnassius mnemosyne]|uniref:PHD-type domain-containing protein n=1 Tax=Parnassius mnemosyne TaxID=213953 RepID=A0AAV1L8M9_9NEOP
MAAKGHKNVVWGCCSIGLQDQNYMQCTECTKLYHLECLSLSSNQDDSSTSNWLCPQCHGTQKMGNNDNTPVRYNPNITVRPGRRQALNSPPNASDEKPITRYEMQEIIKDVVTQFQKTMHTTISDILGSELKSLKEKIVDMKESMSFMNMKYESITKEHAEASEKIKRLETKNGALQSKVDDLYNRVNQMEQNARMNNIEIQCVPERKDENLLHIVTELGKTIHCQVSTEHLAHYTRNINWSLVHDLSNNYVAPSPSQALIDLVHLNKLNQMNNILNKSDRLLDLVLTNLSSSMCTAAGSVDILSVVDPLHPPLEILIKINTDIALLYNV